MQAGPPDLAQVRLDNALALFEEFVRQTARHADAATLRGLERRFAERLQIQPSYWSQIKGRSRQIGERLARQFEHLSHKPRGWMDVPHAIAARLRAALQRGDVPGGRAARALPQPATRWRRATTTSASSSASCSPTTAATRSAHARACWTCWARC